MYDDIRKRRWKNGKLVLKLLKNHSQLPLIKVSICHTSVNEFIISHNFTASETIKDWKVVKSKALDKVFYYNTKNKIGQFNTPDAIHAYIEGSPVAKVYNFP